MCIASFEGDKDCPNLYGSLRERLKIALASLQPDIKALKVKIGEGVSPPIPLKLIQTSEGIRFVSAIALRLEKPWQQPALAIAEQVAQQISLPLQTPDSSNQADWAISNKTIFWSGVQVSVQAPGWIVLDVQDLGLAQWLQQVSLNHWQISPGLVVAPANPNIKSLWQLQVAHARCCGLLSLGAQQGVIKLCQLNSDATPNLWQIIEPSTIPWLQSDRTLRLAHPTERRVIAQLVTTAEYLCGPDSFSLGELILKQGQALIQAFWNWEAACRIFGVVHIEQPALAQARLGLVLAVQACLSRLLIERLGISAPLAL